MSTIYIDGRQFNNRKVAIEFLELNENAVLICDNEKEKEELKTQYPKLAGRFILWSEKTKGERNENSNE